MAAGAQDACLHPPTSGFDFPPGRLVESRISVSGRILSSDFLKRCARKIVRLGIALRCLTAIGFLAPRRRSNGSAETFPTANGNFGATNLVEPWNEKTLQSDFSESGIGHGRFDKLSKERMRVHGTGFELRMELAPQVPRVIAEFYDFDQISAG